MARRRTRGLPPGGRYTDTARTRIALTVIDPVTGKRLSHSKVVPGEDKTYLGEDAAWEGYERIKAWLLKPTTSRLTLGEFVEQWTDDEHWKWGKQTERGPAARKRLRSTTRGFLAFEYEGTVNEQRTVDAITTANIEAFMEAGGKPSNLNGIATLFRDAIKEGLIAEHPCRDQALKSDKAERKARRARRKRIGVPEQAQIDAMLDRATEAVYPDSLYGWLKVGVETGLRGGEIDTLEWEYLDSDACIYHVEWQWNEGLKDFTAPKHESFRKVPIDDHTMEVIETYRGIDRRFVFVNSARHHWTHHTRDYWWRNTPRDGGPSLRQIVGGRTIYNATRHFWASRAVNVWGMSPSHAAELYGHKDGGKTIVEHYLHPNLDLAVQAAQRARAAQPVDLRSVRRQRRAI